MRSKDTGKDQVAGRHYMDALKKYRTRFILAHSLADFFFNRFRFFGSRALARLISKLFLPPFDQRVICPTIYGFDVLLNPEKNSEIHEIYNLGFYEAGTLDVFKKCLRAGDIFIDIGASIGLMALYAAKVIGTSGKALAFEPTKKGCDVFSESIALNRFSNISLFKMGLGNERRMIPIYTNRACPSMVELDVADPHEIVEIDRLDDVLAREGVFRARLIKVDVEGFELEVLKGAEKILSGKEAPIVCLEYMKALIRDKEENAVRYLKRVNKYQFFQLQKSKNTVSKLQRVENESDFRNDDNIFCFLDAHIVSLPKDMFVK